MEGAAFKKGGLGAVMHDWIGAELPAVDKDEEKEILAGFIFYPQMRAELSAMLPEPEAFMEPAHQVIYRRLLAMHGEGAAIDMATLFCALRDAGELADADGDWVPMAGLEARNGQAYLEQIYMLEVSGTGAPFLAKKLAARAMQRALMQACVKGIGDVKGAAWQEVAEAGAGLAAGIKALLDRSAGTPPQDVAGTLLGDMQALEWAAAHAPMAVPTGYRSLDRMLGGGMGAGDMVVLAARPGVGKSAFALGIGWRNALAGRRVAFFSVEMPRRQIWQRLLAMASGVSLEHIRNPQPDAEGGGMTDAEWESVYAATPLMQVPLHIVDGAQTPSRIRQTCEAIRRKSGGLDLVIVDYLQRCRADGKSWSREAEVASISDALKRMAMDMNLPVLALAQLNRSIDSFAREDKRPQLSDLRESGAIEQDADAVAFLHRDVPDAADSIVPTETAAELILRKCRNGSPGSARLLFCGSTTSYVDAMPQLPEAAPQRRPKPAPAPAPKPAQKPSGYEYAATGTDADADAADLAAFDAPAPW